MIIRQQISHDKAFETMKINQISFIRKLIIEENFVKYNINVILIKVGFTIDIGEGENYEKTNL